jgi:hypothetical protein
MRSQSKCWIWRRHNTATIGKPKREECATDKTQRAGILSHPRSVHSVALRQNEAGYWLEYGKHIIQPFGIVLADWENDSCADGGSIPVRHCVRPGTKLLLILAGDDVQPAMVQKIQHKGWCWISYWHNPTA